MIKAEWTEVLKQCFARNLSVKEIAAQYGVTRQCVDIAIKRCDLMALKPKRPNRSVKWVEAIKELLKTEPNLTHSQVAEKLGVTRGYIGWLHRKFNLFPKREVHVCVVCNHRPAIYTALGLCQACYHSFCYHSQPKMRIRCAKYNKNRPSRVCITCEQLAPVTALGICQRCYFMFRYYSIDRTQERLHNKYLRNLKACREYEETHNLQGKQGRNEKC